VEKELAMTDGKFPEGTHHPVGGHHEARRHMAPSKDIQPHKIKEDPKENAQGSDDQQPASTAEG
jgi:hypothetical protein